MDIDRLALEEFGTGPFKIVEHLPGERTTLVRYDDYWEEGKPYLDELVVLSISEPATRDAALKAGDVDAIYRLSAQSVPGLAAHRDTRVLSASTFSYIAMSIPHVTPPFDNLLVRKAMQAAMDRESINQAALLGMGTIARDTPFHPAHPAFAPQYAPPDYDIELAKSLLAEAGYPDGIDITLYTADTAAGMIEMSVAIRRGCCAGGHSGRRPESAFGRVLFNVLECGLILHRQLVRPHSGRSPDRRVPQRRRLECAEIQEREA